MTTLSSSEVREIFPTIKEILHQCVTYLNIKNGSYLNVEELALGDDHGSTFTVFNIYQTTEEGPEEFYIPFSIFDAWANVITDLQRKRKEVQDRIDKQQEIRDLAEYERLKAKFERED